MTKGITPTPNITRTVSPHGPDYFILNSDGDANIAAVRWTRYNLIRIGPEGEGGPAPGGIITADPEDVRWFARNLLELADRMESARR